MTDHVPTEIDQIVFSTRVALPDPEKGLVIVPAAIGISGAVITSIERISREVLLKRPIGAGTKLIDAGSRLVTPAFINAHTHLPMIAFRAIGQSGDFQGNVVEELFFRLENDITPADVRAFTRIGAYESLLGGVGCVWEHYYYAEEVAQALVDVGLSGVVAPTLQDKGGPGVDQCERQLEATVDIAASTSLREEGVVAALGPHATDTVSSELWTRIRGMADDLSLPIHSHVSQSIEEFERSQEEYGCSPIERLSREGTLAAGPAALLVHALFTSESDLGLLSPERHVLGYCPYSQVQFCFPAPILAWRAHDIPIALGTDCAACNDTMSVQRELRVYAGAEAFQVTHGEAMSRYLSGGSLEQARDVWAGRTERFDGSMACVSEADRLASVWGVPGNLHPALPLGEIRVGYRANLLIFDVDHPSFWPRADLLRALSFSDSVPAIWGMLVNGKWMGRRGEFHRSIYSSLAYKEALTEADERIQLLLKRL